MQPHLRVGLEDPLSAPRSFVQLRMVLIEIKEKEILPSSSQDYSLMKPLQILLPLGLSLLIWIMILILWNQIKNEAKDEIVKKRIRRNLIMTAIIGTIGILGGFWL